MSTRCQIVTLDRDGSLYPVKIYKHGDGYPDGVMDVLEPFAKAFAAGALAFTVGREPSPATPRALQLDRKEIAMRTRRSHRQQERLYRALGADLARASTQPPEGYEAIQRSTPALRDPTAKTPNASPNTSAGMPCATRERRPAMYQRKTKDEYQIHVRYGDRYGWEHEISEDSLREARERRKEYRENVQYPVRIIKKRVPLAGGEAS